MKEVSSAEVRKLRVRANDLSAPQNNETTISLIKLIRALAQAIPKSEQDRKSNK